jgi:hypothetical protein
MAWRYYRKGKLVKECDNIPETMDDAVRELRENGVDVSDCVVEVDDCWSPDYPPEESEEWIKDDMLVKPLTDDELIAYGKLIQQLKNDNIFQPAKLSNDFEDKLFNRIRKEHGVELKSNNWWNKWTTGEKQYLSFWIIYLYLLLGLVITQEPKIVGMVAEIILWPLFM